MVYLERAISARQERSRVLDQQLLAHLSPLNWEHINLTGDYHWRRDGGLRNRKLDHFGANRFQSACSLAYNFLQTEE